MMEAMNKHVFKVLLMLSFSHASAAPGDPANLAWQQGHWCQQTDEGLVEEYWLAPANGETIGLGRTLSGGKTASFEFMRITDGDGALNFIAQPGGAPPTTFVAITGNSDAQRIAFENPEHDFPSG
jgi:hypothetical protein